MNKTPNISDTILPRLVAVTDLASAQARRRQEGRQGFVGGGGGHGVKEGMCKISMSSVIRGGMQRFSLPVQGT